MVSGMRWLYLCNRGGQMPAVQIVAFQIISDPPPMPFTMTPLVKRCMDVVWRQWLVVNICAYIPATDDSSTALPPPCFSSRAYSLRGDRAVPFRSLWPPGASQKISITTGPGQPLTASTMIPDISRHETTNMNAADISIWEEEKSGGMHGALNVAFVFAPPSAAQIATAQPLNSGFSSLPVVFFPANLC